ncbi:MAG TPA: TIGR04552 family protein [Anaeromyxobacteraceae bacterium]|nr:TIGR04552 family protein [Anaeromyxobacteraceae bacterium]
MDVRDLEVLRLVLRGGSVVDWRRLHFRDAAEVDRFLRLSLLDLRDPRDEARVRAILAQAVEYLRSAYGYRVAPAVAAPDDLRTLFLLASGAAEPQRYRRIACVVLKVMHVVHHLEARELLFRTPLRESDLSDRVDRRVMAVAQEMQRSGLPVVEFQGSRKSRASLVTKLLVKRESVAAQVFDRVRYRIIVDAPSDVAPVIRHLFELLSPFNYVVPGQSENTLVPFRRLVGAHPRAAEIAAGLQEPLELEAGRRRRDNPFSEDTYRALHFVVDLPVRIDDLLPDGPPRDGEDLGRIVFSMVEFQVMDAEAARRNEAGPASHRRYKKRQAVSALRRLSRGLVVPKKRRVKTG